MEYILSPLFLLGKETFFFAHGVNIYELIIENYKTVFTYGCWDPMTKKENKSKELYGLTAVKCCKVAKN